jgi:hypothetical protein
VAPYLWARALVYLTDKDPELNLKQEIIEVRLFFYAEYLVTFAPRGPIPREFDEVKRK